MADSPKIGIVGAGIVGLTTALCLHEELPGANITIIADKFYADTTSHVSAGHFMPGHAFHGPDQNTTKKWIVDSWNHWNDMLWTPEASLAGVASLSCYMFSNYSEDATRNPLIEDIVPIYRKATGDELKICGEDMKYGSFLSSFLIESRIYLPWAAKKHQSKGGIIMFKPVKSFPDIAMDYDIIMNCSGLGARELCNDMKLVGMRGQVIKVKAPWIKTAFYGDDNTYIIPGFETVTLGATRQYDNYNTNVNRHDAEDIMERCVKLLPSLKHAEIVEHAVGLRPHRDVVRVEGEVLSLPGKNLKVVHCYGHGGYGVTTAPGTAKHAVRIAKEMLMTNSKL